MSTSRVNQIRASYVKYGGVEYKFHINNKAPLDLYGIFDEKKIGDCSSALLEVTKNRGGVGDYVWDGYISYLFQRDETRRNRADAVAEQTQEDIIRILKTLDLWDEFVEMLIGFTWLVTIQFNKEKLEAFQNFPLLYWLSLKPFEVIGFLQQMKKCVIHGVSWKAPKDLLAIKTMGEAVADTTTFDTVIERNEKTNNIKKILPMFRWRGHKRQLIARFLHSIDFMAAKTYESWECEKFIQQHATQLQEEVNGWRKFNSDERQHLHNVIRALIETRGLTKTDQFDISRLENKFYRFDGKSFGNSDEMTSISWDGSKNGDTVALLEDCVLCPRPSLPIPTGPRFVSMQHSPWTLQFDTKLQTLGTTF